MYGHLVFLKWGKEQKVNVGAVLLILYYNVNGSTSNVADNVKRIGLLHIKTIDFKMYNNTVNALHPVPLNLICTGRRKTDYSKVQ